MASLYDACTEPAWEQLYIHIIRICCMTYYGTLAGDPYSNGLAIFRAHPPYHTVILLNVSRYFGPMS